MKEKSSKILSYKNFLGAKFTPGKDEVESKIKGAAKGLKSCRLSPPALCTAAHVISRPGGSRGRESELPP